MKIAISSSTDTIYAIHMAQELAKEHNKVIYVIDKGALLYATTEFQTDWLVKAYPGGRTISQFRK